MSDADDKASDSSIRTEPPSNTSLNSSVSSISSQNAVRKKTSSSDKKNVDAALKKSNSTLQEVPSIPNVGSDSNKSNVSTKPVSDGVSSATKESLQFTVKMSEVENGGALSIEKSSLSQKTVSANAVNDMTEPGASQNQNVSATGSQKMEIDDSGSNENADTFSDVLPVKISRKRKRSTAAEENTSASASVASSNDQEDSFDNTDKDKKKKNRCHICRKKVGLTGFECRCGGLFCSVHRYSDKHACPFDYREMGAQEIRRNNPVVVGEKIQKI